MILTQCPSCRTLFRLEEVALRACGGAVRCGQCGAVFQADVYRIDESTPKDDAVRSPSWKRWSFATLATLLTLALVAQALYVTRNALARVTFMRPAVQALCSHVRCRLIHPAALDQYQLVHPEVRLGSHTGVLHIRAELVNQARFRQSLPLLSVTLLGPSRAVLARANYSEKAYLRHPQKALGPKKGIRVRLDLHVPASASGYRLALFPTNEE